MAGKRDGKARTDMTKSAARASEMNAGGTLSGASRSPSPKNRNDSKNSKLSGFGGNTPGSKVSSKGGFAGIDLTTSEL